jgi:cyclopropane-fatty-acyl-phospholipid synthase
MKEQVKALFAKADVQINGTRPWDIQVHDERFYQRVLSDGTLGVGESYMDGWWDCEDMVEMSFRTQRAGLENKLKRNWKFLLAIVQAKLFNLQTRKHARRDIKHHYDIGNDLYTLMLDKRMTYTCAYWKNANTLDKAQEAKLDLVCKKIGLKKGMRVLDIGCGFGSFAKYAAQKYGVSVVGITISNEQLKLARELCKGLPIEIRFQDYRDINEKFDRIVSIGMFEAVGYKNFREYMRVAHRCLKDDGLFLLHTIGSNVTIKRATPWVDKYIFPGAVIPSIAQIGESIERLFVMEDWHNFGNYYATTTLAWWNNFNKAWPKLKDKYGERFYKMWKFYLLMGSGIAKAREVGLWQIVMSKKGIVGGYQSIR